MFQDIRQFSELAHSPSGGFYLFSKADNMMFTHVPLTHTPQWCDTTAVICPSLPSLAVVQAFPENAADRETLKRTFCAQRSLAGHLVHPFLRSLHHAFHRGTSRCARRPTTPPMLSTTPTSSPSTRRDSSAASVRAASANVLRLLQA